MTWKTLDYIIALGVIWVIYELLNPTEAKPGTIIPPVDPIAGYELIFEDHFTGSTIDRTKWLNIYDFCWGTDWKNTSRPSQLSLRNSQLLMKFSTGSDCGKNYIGVGLDNYSSSHKQYLLTEGIWEIRVKMPRPSELHYIGWYAGLFPEDPHTWPPEVDFAEIGSGWNINQVSFTQHWGEHINGSHPSKYKIIPLDTGTFHTYRVILAGGKMKWYVDDMIIPKETQTQNSPLTTKWKFAMGILAYGSHTPTGLPIYANVDYVRIYKKK